MQVKLTITIDEAGRCSVEGPLHNKIMCYGILEEAKHVIREFDPNKKVITPPAPGARLNGG